MLCTYYRRFEESDYWDEIKTDFFQWCDGEYITKEFAKLF